MTAPMAPGACLPMQQAREVRRGSGFGPGDAARGAPAKRSDATRFARRYFGSAYFPDAGAAASTNRLRSALATLQRYADCLVQALEAESEADSLAQLDLLGDDVRRQFERLGLADGAAARVLRTMLAARPTLEADAADWARSTPEGRVGPGLALFDALSAVATDILGAVRESAAEGHGARADRLQREAHAREVAAYVEQIARLRAAWVVLCSRPDIRGLGQAGSAKITDDPDDHW